MKVGDIMSAAPPNIHLTGYLIENTCVGYTGILIFKIYICTHECLMYYILMKMFKVTTKHKDQNTRR